MVVIYVMSMTCLYVALALTLCRPSYVCSLKPNKKIEPLAEFIFLAIIYSTAAVLLLHGSACIGTVQLSWSLGDVVFRNRYFIITVKICMQK